jgi:hypothetical protein
LWIFSASSMILISSKLQEQLPSTSQDSQTSIRRNASSLENLLSKTKYNDGGAQTTASGSSSTQGTPSPQRPIPLIRELRSNTKRQRSVEPGAGNSRKRSSTTPDAGLVPQVVKFSVCNSPFSNYGE